MNETVDGITNQMTEQQKVITPKMFIKELPSKKTPNPSVNYPRYHPHLDN